MTRLRDFDQNAILLWWAEAPTFAQSRYGRVARLGESYHIDSRDLQISRLRQYIPRLLRRRGYLPRNREPNNADYDLAAERFLAWWYSQEMN